MPAAAILLYPSTWVAIGEAAKWTLITLGVTGAGVATGTKCPGLTSTSAPTHEAVPIAARKEDAHLECLRSGPASSCGSIALLLRHRTGLVRGIMYTYGSEIRTLEPVNASGTGRLRLVTLSALIRVPMFPTTFSSTDPCRSCPRSLTARSPLTSGSA